jgi:hypothetical protein
MLCVCCCCSGVDDEFADFNSAFSGNVTLSSSTVGNSSQQLNSSQTAIPGSNGNLGKDCRDLYCSVALMVMVTCIYLSRVLEVPHALLPLEDGKILTYGVVIGARIINEHLKW